MGNVGRAAQCLGAPGGTVEMVGRGGRLGFVVVASVVMAGCTWPMFRYDATHSGNATNDTTVALANVSTMHLLWSATIGTGMAVPTSPIATDNTVYAGAGHSMFAYDATGNTSCSGTPKRCSPMWTDALPNTADVGGSGPALDGNWVLASSGRDDKMYAFDARGSANCAGTPKVCEPLWSANGGGSPPTIVNGHIFVGSDGLKVFDANATLDCSGTPKVCQPLWTSSDVIWVSPAVANGIVYAVNVNGVLEAFDANGSQGCGGTPKVCQPLWQAPFASHGVGAPAVVNNVVYVTSFDDGRLFAFDATGNINCSGTPRTCAPLWTAVMGNTSSSSPAVANGRVYAGSNAGLMTFDAAGQTGCSGTPKTCAPLWTFQVADQVQSSPAVANGIVYWGASGGEVFAMDAAGTKNCSGTPTVCAELWSGATGSIQSVVSDVALSDGRVFVTDFLGGLYAYGP